jgi:hypothetical protein
MLNVYKGMAYLSKFKYSKDNKFLKLRTIDTKAHYKIFCNTEIFIYKDLLRGLAENYYILINKKKSIYLYKPKLIHLEKIKK